MIAVNSSAGADGQNSYERLDSARSRTFSSSAIFGRFTAAKPLMPALMHILRPAFVALLVALAVPSTATAWELEAGPFGIWHLFSDTNELGQAEGQERAIDNGFGLGGRAALWPVFNVGVEAEIFAIPSAIAAADTSVLVTGARLHGLVRFGNRRLRGLFMAGYGFMNAFPLDVLKYGDDTDAILYAGGGAQYRLDNLWSVRLDARIHATGTTVPGETLSFDGHVTFGVAYHIGSGPVNDWDVDHVIDDKDACPFAEEWVNKIRDHDGCPEDPLIARNIVSVRDDKQFRLAAKRIAEGRKGRSSKRVDPTKLPVHVTQVWDPGDDPLKQPTTDDPRWLLPPLLSVGDDDGDGLDRDDDICPEVPEDKDGFQDLDGCPEADNDGDGFLDKDDKCPNEAETLNGFDDTDGCPDSVPKKLKRIVGKLDGVYFEKNSADLKKRSNRSLGRAAKILLEFPRVRVRIEGHTDNIGTRELNIDLSKRRAESVRAWLIKAGLPGDRLTSEGYGPDKPKADNKTRRGRATNRRVEFFLIPPKPDDKPGGEEIIIEGQESAAAGDKAAPDTNKNAKKVVPGDSGKKASKDAKKTKKAATKGAAK